MGENILCSSSANDALLLLFENLCTFKMTNDNPFEFEIVSRSNLIILSLRLSLLLFYQSKENRTGWFERWHASKWKAMWRILIELSSKSCRRVGRELLVSLVGDEVYGRW